MLLAPLRLKTGSARQVRRVADVGGVKQADVLDFLIMIPLYGEERKALPPGRSGVPPGKAGEARTL